MQTLTQAQVFAASLISLAARALSKLPTKFLRTVKFKDGRITKVRFVQDHKGVITVKTRGLPPIVIAPRPASPDGTARFAAKVGTFRFFGLDARSVYRQAVACAWN